MTSKLTQHVFKVLKKHYPKMKLTEQNFISWGGHEAHFHITKDNVSLFLYRVEAREWMKTPFEARTSYTNTHFGQLNLRSLNIIPPIERSMVSIPQLAPEDESLYMEAMRLIAFALPRGGYKRKREFVVPSKRKTEKVSR